MKKKTNEFIENQSFDYTELTALCEHLKIREREGKRLKEIDKYNLTYDNCEPREIRYSAVIFNQELMHKDFIATCEQEGWEYVDRHNELYIFRTQNPDASEIITDEKENLRTVTKAFLLNPRFLGFSYVTFSTVIRLIFHCLTSFDLPWEPPLPADTFLFSHLFMTSISLAIVIIQTEDFLEWYIKAKKAVRNGGEIPFINLKEREFKLIGRRILYSILLTTVFILFVMVFHGYNFEKWLFYLIAFTTSLAGGITIYESTKSKGKLKVTLSTFLTLAIILSASYGLYLSFEKAYNENPYIIKENNIPITIADFCYGECQCTNEISRHGETRLAQYYRIHSYCSVHDNAIYYNIFKSNKKHIKRYFIEKLKEDIEEYRDLISCNMENSGWDEQYKESFKGEITEYGFAVKDNTVVYFDFHTIDKDVSEDIGFFDIAYNKLFK